MSLSMVSGPSFVVPSGQANSQAVHVEHSISDADVMSIYSPATLPETANLQLSPDYDASAPSSATWVDADATNAPVGTAGQFKTIQTTYLVARAIRVHLNGNAAASRTFITNKRMVL